MSDAPQAQSAAQNRYWVPAPGSVIARRVATFRHHATLTDYAVTFPAPVPMPKVAVKSKRLTLAFLASVAQPALETAARATK